MERLITYKYYDTWTSLLDIKLEDLFAQIEGREWNAENFKFATAVSVMSSSKIEGEILEVDSYIKHKVLDIEYLPNLTEKPDDLYTAYEFARDNNLNEVNFLRALALAAQHLLPQSRRGFVRKGNMLIMEQQTQQVQYEAAPAGMVQAEFDVFWDELNELLQADLQTEEAFYYAALIHLIFVKIHPFDDGNGRTGRLLEKWFLAEKLGEKAWYVPSELYYYNHLKSYYHNLARVGLFYEELKYEKGIPFLLMLPQSLVSEK